MIVFRLLRPLNANSQHQLTDGVHMCEGLWSPRWWPLLEHFYMHTRQPRQTPTQQELQRRIPTGCSDSRVQSCFIWLFILFIVSSAQAQQPAASPGSAPETSPPAVPADSASADTPSNPPADIPLADRPPTNSPIKKVPAAQPPAARPTPPTEQTTPQSRPATSPALSAATTPSAPPAAAAVSAGSPATEKVSTPQAATNEPAADGTVSVVIAPAETPPPPPAAIAPLAAAAMPASRQPESLITDQPAKSVATQLLEQILEPLENRQATPDNNIDRAMLYARPLSLLEALQRSGDRSRRLWITQAYWKVSAGYASIRFASEAVDQLQLVAPGGDPHDQAVLDVAIAAAKADLAAAHAELIATQQQLADLARLPIGEPSPWPVDRPLAGAYQTHFAAIFATRPATGRIRAIDRMLPSKHDAVEARATAFMAAQAAMQRAEADHARGKRPIEAVIAAHHMLQQQQLGFIDSLAAYNLDIAEYAMAVADASVPDDRYVSMLIGTPIQWSPQPAQGVLPAGGLQRVEQQVTLPR